MLITVCYVSSIHSINNTIDTVCSAETLMAIIADAALAYADWRYGITFCIVISIAIIFLFIFIPRCK